MEKNEPWLSPTERYAEQCTLQGILDDSCSNVGSFYQLYQMMLRSSRERNISTKDTKTNTVQKVFLELPSISYPATVPLCPSSSNVKRMMSNDGLFISVFSMEGYNFSAEFESIYRRSSDRSSVFDDAVAVCTRAVLWADSKIEAHSAVDYAELILRIVAWEALISPTACSSVLQELLPSSNLAVLPADLTIGKVYIGCETTNSGVQRMTEDDKYSCLSFWVRICHPVEFAEGQPADSATQSRGVPWFSSFGAMTRRRDSGLHQSVEDFDAARCSQLCYYRKYELTPEVVKNFKQSNTENMTTTPAPPPPPPKPPAEGDYRILLLCAQPSSPGHQDNTVVDEDILDGKPSRESQLQASLYQEVKHFSVTSATTTAILTPDPSACAELLVWGDFTPEGSLDATAAGAEAKPQPMPLPASLVLERVRMVACSARHTLVLSFLGNVYACGDNSEGALGMGDIIDRRQLSLVHWPTDDLLSVKIVMVAAGAGAIGSHSAAIDSQGLLYTWGVPQATGHGTVRPALSPALLDTFPLDEDEQRRRLAAASVNENRTNVNDEETETMQRLVTDALPCAHVACGGGFTLAVLRSGHVCTWGAWAHGRLGLGHTPLLRTEKKQARYQLRPAFVRGISNAAAAACGEAHVLCLLQGGELMAWGQNSCGQLGVGTTIAGYLRDEPMPVRVKPFTKRIAEGDKVVPEVSLRKVFAGSYHSVAIDVEGGVWTWGARGSPCLGHCDPVSLDGPWGQSDMRKVNALFNARTGQPQIMIPYGLLGWCRRWSLPRRVAGFGGDADLRVEDACGGDMHTAFVTSDGELYLCGAGPVVAPFLSTAALEEEDDDEEEKEERQEVREEGREEAELTNKQTKDSGGENNEAHAKKAAEKRKKDAKRARLEKIDLSSVASVVCCPRRPSAAWLPALSARRTLFVAGAGMRCFALQDEELLSRAVTFPLFRRLLLGPGATSGDRNDVDAVDDVSLESHERSEIDGSAASSSYFEHRGRADMMLITGGKMLLAHRAVLSQRSPELREMITMEEPTDAADVDYGMVTQVLLPELQAAAAKVLLSYLYTDVLPASCLSDISMLRAMQRAGKTLRMPRLQLLAERLLRAIKSVESVASSVGQKQLNVHQLGSYGSYGDLPPATLSRDMGAIVGDPLYADVRFVAEGKAVAAHRFVLEARSEYFRAMFRSGMAEAGAAIGSRMIDVVVPDTFVGFLRLLIFLYTDSLPDTSDSALLEDLMAADRYAVAEMKRLCVSMLVPSVDNWLELLHTAEAVGDASLRAQAVAYVRDHLPELSEQEMQQGQEGASPLSQMRMQFPEILAEAQSMREEFCSPPPPPQVYLRRAKNASEATQQVAAYKPILPLWAVGVAIVAALLYQQIGRIVVLGPVVPVVNVVFIIALAWLSLRAVTTTG